MAVGADIRRVGASLRMEAIDRAADALDVRPKIQGTDVLNQH